MVLCTSDEVVTEKARDLCPMLMQEDQDDTSTCISHFTISSTRQLITSPVKYVHCQLNEIS